jgi:glutathione synthase/RimK-type ligase-like ATP-grasp enzyme
VRRVALATALRAEDPDETLLLEELRAAGLAARAVAWDASDPFDDDLVVIRSTWDYTERVEEFLAWARGVAHLANPYPVVAYSADKSYLGDLAARGFPVVPTTFLAVGDDIDIPDGDVVVKPQIGAGSIDAARYSSAERHEAAAHVGRLHARGRAALVQPYVASVDTHGERALIFIDGHFSHAMTKGAMLNVAAEHRSALYRYEQMTIASAEMDALALARGVLDEVAADPLYARVDLVRQADGWALMELELVEPSLFLVHHPPAAAALVRAIRRRLP